MNQGHKKIQTELQEEKVIKLWKMLQKYGYSLENLDEIKEIIIIFSNQIYKK